MKYTTVLRDTVCFYCFLSESVYFIFILLGCWILPHYQTERIVTEYLWVWLSALFMIILYGIMFAVISHWFKISHGTHWQRHRGALDMESDDDKKLKAVANSMLLLVPF
jgi:hypothetical protein